MTNELIIKVLLYASEITYDKVGKIIGNNEFTLSKYTIWKIINRVTIEIKYNNEIKRGNEKIHVQVDEKYIGMVNSKNKKKYYTVTIFAGVETTKKGKKLLNKTYISSASMDEVKERINATLKERYKVKEDEVIYISGDLANYIQKLKEYITVCESIYVPDKFHIFKTLKDLLPNFVIDEESINNEAMQNTIITELNKIKDNVDARKLKSLINKYPDCFKPYQDKDYQGCSQEGVNSHIYAPRFGKYANRFSPSTIEKLSLIREATALNAQIVIKHKKRKIPDIFDIDIYDGAGKIVRDILDTSGMKAQTVKMFNAIKYGRV